MNRNEHWNRKTDRPGISQAVENSLQSCVSTVAWLFILIIIFNICGLIGGVASLLDRLIQGEDYVPYIGAWTAAVLFIFTGFGSTSLLAPKDRPTALYAMGILTMFILLFLFSLREIMHVPVSS